MSRVVKAVPLVVLCALIIAVPSVWANWLHDGVILCTASGDQYFPVIVSDGEGGAIVTWNDYRSIGDIYAQRVHATGVLKWTANGVALCAATGAQVSPTITSDGAGGAIVTWVDDRGRSLAIYAQRVDASGAVKWMTDGVALCTAPGSKGWPQITSDGAGGAIVTWGDHNRSGAFEMDIYAQRVDASGAVQWMVDGVALCAGTGNHVFPTIVSDGAGGAIVTWVDTRSGNSDIYAQRVSAAGVVKWTANGVALCAATEDQEAPQITSDGANGAIVAWYDARSGNNDIYARRVDASGVVQWTANGVALCTATGDQSDPKTISDGEGGAIVTWNDGRGGSNDIYAQRVDASGAVQWTANGVALCTATGGQSSPTIVSDGAGGAVVTWEDYRSANTDIYAQRVNASGAVQWTANGVALCTVTGEQWRPTITSDGWSGAIVTWGDYRTGTSWKIYAQRVDASGFAPSAANDAPAVPIELHQNYPNPFNPATTVAYSIPERCSVAVKIYDVSGKCVACLVDRQQEKGSHAVEWNGKDEKGNSAASGIYLCRLAAGNQTISRKMVLLK